MGTRIDWASLLRRIYLEDVLACPCGGRRRLVAAIDEPSAMVAILEHLGPHENAIVQPWGTSRALATYRDGVAISIVRGAFGS